VGTLGGAWPFQVGFALPPADEVPEEVLRTRIITEARSPIDGEPLSAAEYARLQEQLQNVNDSGMVDSDLAQLIFLLQLRRVVKPILPFFP
jgi:hypothetical protein